MMIARKKRTLNSFKYYISATTVVAKRTKNIKILRPFSIGNYLIHFGFEVIL